MKPSCMELSKPLDCNKKAVPDLLQHTDTCESKMEPFQRTFKDSEVGWCLNPVPFKLLS